MPQTPKSSVFPAPPLPRPGQQRAYWRQPASASALAWSIAGAAQAHDGPLLAVARDNHAAHQLESDLRTLLGDNAALPVLNFPDWETLPYDRFSPHRSEEHTSEFQSLMRISYAVFCLNK